MARKLMDTAAAAEHYGCSPATLKMWRAKGVGPPHIKLLGLVRYRQHDLDAHARQNRRTSIGDDDLTVQNLEATNAKPRRP